MLVTLSFNSTGSIQDISRVYYFFLYALLDSLYHKNKKWNSASNERVGLQVVADLWPLSGMSAMTTTATASTMDTIFIRFDASGVILLQ